MQKNKQSLNQSDAVAYQNDNSLSFHSQIQGNTTQ